MAKLKVVCVGREARTDRLFNIVKIGDYPTTKEGFIAAFKDGFRDKFKAEPPEFKCIVFNLVEAYDDDEPTVARAYKVYVFACLEVDADTGEESLLSGKVTYSKILKNG